MPSRMDKYSPTRAELRSMEGQWRYAAREERAKEKRTAVPCTLSRLAKLRAALISKFAC